MNCYYKICTSILLLVAVFSSAQCKKVEVEDFGILAIQVYLDSQSMDRLQSAGYSKIEVNAKARFNEKLQDITIRYAGRSTIDDVKKSYDIKIKDGSFLGLPRWRLSSMGVDRSGIRTRLGFSLFSWLDAKELKSDYVGLYINNEYKGLYTLLEPVNQSFFERRGVEISRLFKSVYGNADFEPDMVSKLSTSIDAKMDHGTAEIEGIIEVLQKNELESLSKILDIDQYVRYIAVSILLDNWDGYKNNMFLYRSSGGKFRVQPWDLDRVLEREPSEELKREVFELEMYGQNGISKVVFSEEKWRQQLLVHIKTLLEGEFDLEKITKLIDSYASEASKAYNMDPLLTHFNLNGEKEELIQRTKMRLEQVSQYLEDTPQ